RSPDASASLCFHPPSSGLRARVPARSRRPPYTHAVPLSLRLQPSLASLVGQIVVRCLVATELDDGARGHPPQESDPRLSGQAIPWPLKISANSPRSRHGATHKVGP